MALHEVFHIRPRSKDSLTCDSGMAVEDMIKDLYAQMRHADFVHVWEGQADEEIDISGILFDGVYLVAKVARRLAHTEKKALKQICIEHNKAIPKT